MALAALSQAVVAYPGAAPVLGPLDMTAEEGRITALVGPSGCGKSTVLRLLAGLQQPSSGLVDRAIPEGRTAMVFQAPTLAPWLSAASNVALPLRLAGVGKAQALSRAEAELERVGLTHAARLKPAQLSGGMAMRVALARALVVRPRLLLLDEPFAALDAFTRRDLIDDVHRLWAETRPGVVFVTHDLDEATYFAHDILVMTAGPGRIHAALPSPGDLPRPPGHRASGVFLETVSAAERAAGQAMAA